MEKRQAKFQAFKDRLRARWQAWMEANYDRQLDKFYQDSYGMYYEVEDEPFMEAEDKILRELREQQQLDDEAKSEWEQAQRLKQERAAEFFNYALEHPELPEAERHLEECLDKALESLDQVRRGIAYETSQLSLSSKGSLEEASANNRLKAYKVERAKLENVVNLIHQAFESVPETE